MALPRYYDTYESLIGERDALRLSAPSLSEERVLVASTIERLARTGYYPEAGELEQRYVAPALSSPTMQAANVTRIADVVNGITRTRFVPEERGYVFEVQTSGTRERPIVLYHASSTPIASSQYDPTRVRLEWIGKDPSKDHSIGRMQDPLFKRQFRQLRSAVRDTL